MTISLADIKLRVLDLADMKNTGFIGDDELTFYINQEYTELYDLVVASFEDYFMNNLQFTLTGNQDGYSMPNQVYKLRGVDYNVNSGPTQWYSLNRFMFGDRNRYNTPWGLIGWYPWQNLMYSWTGSMLKIIPETQAAGTYRVWYTPHLVQLDNTVNMLFDPTLEQWVDIIIVGAAIKCLNKEESDVSVLMAQKQMLVQRIEGLAPNKDNNMPKYVISSWDNFGPGSNGWGNGSGY